MAIYKNKVEEAALERLGLSKEAKSFARKVISRDIDPYTNLRTARASGGKPRSISAPIAQMADIQKHLLAFLEELVRNSNQSRPAVHRAAHAYRKHYSHISAASVHLGMKWGVKVDLRQFYDHITEDHVFKALQSAGLRDEAFYFARLCSRVPKNWPGDLPTKYRRLKRAFLFKERVDAGLNQGTWFAQSKPPRLVADRVNVNRGASKLGGDSYVRLLPPKRLSRLFPTLDKGKYASDFFGRQIALSFVFYRLRKFLHLPSSGQQSAKIYQSAQAARTKWRKFILASYSNSSTFGYISNNPNQTFYVPRPEQYRDFYKLGFLPQGAPTSGILSNMVMVKFDEILFEFCKENSLRYTRYSDDIVVSAYDSTYSREKALEIVSFIQKLAEFNGFTLNKDKTRLIGPNSRKFVLGVLVDGKQVRLGKHERERIDRTIYQVAKFGDFWTESTAPSNLLNETHLLPGKRVGPKSRPSTASFPLESLLGWLSYCKTADHAFLTKIHNELVSNRWAFKDEHHRTEILGHTSTLLGDEKGKSDISSNLKPHDEK
jgi:hypothetical protein